MNSKICETCKTEKSTAEFYKSKNYFSRKCKECSNTKCKNEGCNNRSLNNAQCSECYRKKAGKKKTHRKVVGMKYWLSQCLNSTKRCSKSRLARGYRVKENDLTIEFLLDLLQKQNGLCVVSGIELQSEYKNVCSASIDRINPDFGYLQTNVVLTCQWVNMGRNRTPIEEFRKILSLCKLSSDSFTSS